MGTYKSIKIDVNAFDQETLNEVFSVMRDLDNDKDGDIINFCFRKFSPETKWWADDYVISVSKKLPKLFFRLTCRGGEPSANYDTIIKNGVKLNYDFVMPPKFPSNSLWNSALKRAESIRKQQQEVQRKKEEEKEKQRLANLEREIEEKQAQLVEMKKSLSKLSEHSSNEQI